MQTLPRLQQNQHTACEVVMLLGSEVREQRSNASRYPSDSTAFLAYSHTANCLQKIQMHHALKCPICHSEANR